MSKSAIILPVSVNRQIKGNKLKKNEVTGKKEVAHYAVHNNISW